MTKKIDESWKDSVNKEKIDAPVEPPGTVAALPEANFGFFVSSLGMQALMFLGLLHEPDKPPPAPDLGQARYVIDILQILADKTKGNLTPEEDRMLNDLLYELRLKFVEASGGAA